MPAGSSDVVCFSQLRWDFVFQRPNHLMARAAHDRRVWYVEEPVFDPDGPRLLVEERLPGLSMVRPVLPPGWPEHEIDDAISLLLREFADSRFIRRPIAWYYTPIAVAWTRWLDRAVTVYDCMDELTAFDFASPRLPELEAELLARADVVFTGGMSLFEAKRRRHANVHPFPSAVDAGHFGRAKVLAPATDQERLAAPRIGWFGVIDERMDLELVARIADLRPDWSFVFVGPMVKIDPASFPMRPNVHLFGPRPYEELPAYIAGWDVAMMPFARNRSTRFISPTKTLEYLAAGRPVVSTSIRDVVEPYERLGLVRIADEPGEFVAAMDAALADDLARFRVAADHFVEGHGWDDTWRQMSGLVDAALARDTATSAPEAVASSSGVHRGRVAAPARRR